MTTSSRISSIGLGEPVSYNTSSEHFVIGDIWATAWAADDSLYMLTDDFHGWQDDLLPGGRNVSFCRLDGQPDSLRGTTVNDLAELGAGGELGPDLACWKGSGIASVDGALYMFASRQWYGLWQPGRRETKHDAYLARSEDGGRTWEWSSRGGARAPLFPGPAFAAAYFVEYGQDGEAPDRDNARGYVYAVSTDGAWDNGDCMSLARVRRDRLARLAPEDWQFYLGGDGMQDSAWGGIGKGMGVAAPVISAVRRCSMTGMHYLPNGQYLIMQWHYPTLTPLDHVTSETVWEFYLGDHPWGPFEKAAEFRWPETGLYNPYLPNKFVSQDGRSGTILASGDFQTSRSPWNKTNYTMWSIPVTFT